MSFARTVRSGGARGLTSVAIHSSELGCEEVLLPLQCIALWRGVADQVPAAVQKWDSLTPLQQAEVHKAPNRLRDALVWLRSERATRPRPSSEQGSAWEAEHPELVGLRYQPCASQMGWLLSAALPSIPGTALQARGICHAWIAGGRHCSAVCPVPIAL